MPKTVVASIGGNAVKTRFQFQMRFAKRIYGLTIAF